MITYEDFQKLELRVGTVTTAIRVPDSDKLLQLQVNLGDETRQIVTGLAEIYEPEHFLNKQIIIIANLEPRTFRGVQSHGMLLAADSDKPILLIPETPVAPGTKVK